MRKYLYIIINGSCHKVTDFKMLPDYYIRIKNNEPIPVEDLGDYFFDDNDLSEDLAFKKFLSFLP